MTPALHFRVVQENNVPWQGDGIFPSLRSLRLLRLRSLRIFSLPLSRFREKMTPLREHPVPLPGMNLGVYWEKCHIRRRFKMPTYDFVCEKCNKSFSLMLSIREYEKNNFRCPKCKSIKVRQQITHFQTKTSKKS